MLNFTTYIFSHLLRAGSVRSLVKAWRGIRASVVIGVVLTGSLASAAQAQDQPSDLTELDLEELMQLDIIPIDVMGSHIHLAGDWMVGYRYMNMNMGEGSSHGGSATDFGGFMVQPTSMRMQMHMVEAMYGVTNDLTLMVMLPYKRLSMDHVTLRDRFKRGLLSRTKPRGLSRFDQIKAAGDVPTSLPLTQNDTKIGSKTVSEGPSLHDGIPGHRGPHGWRPLRPVSDR